MSMKKKMIPTKDRPTKPVTIRMPLDVLEDLKRVAPRRNVQGYQALIKFYIRQCLREDLEQLWEEEKSKKLESILSEFGLKEEQKVRLWDILRSHPGLTREQNCEESQSKPEEESIIGSDCIGERYKQ
jgi:hypothetical protein